MTEEQEPQADVQLGGEAAEASERDAYEGAGEDIESSEVEADEQVEESGAEAEPEPATASAQDGTSDAERDEVESETESATSTHTDVEDEESADGEDLPNPSHDAEDAAISQDLDAVPPESSPGFFARIVALFRRSRNVEPDEPEIPEPQVLALRIPGRYNVSSKQELIADVELSEDGETVAVQSLVESQQWFDLGRQSLFGRVAADVATSLDEATADFQDSRELPAQPDITPVRKARAAFQRRVWAITLLLPLVIYLIVRYAGPICTFIGQIPDPPPGSFDPAGIRSTATAMFREIYSHKISWVITAILIAFFYWIRRRNKYYKEARRTQQAIADYQISCQNRIARLSKANTELARLKALNNALDPLCEILAWIVHEPQAEPRGIKSTVEEGLFGEALETSNSLWLGSIQLSSTYLAEERRLALEKEMRLGWLEQILIDVTSISHSDIGLDSNKVMERLERANAAGSGRDVRPALLRQLRSGSILEGVRQRLEQRIIEHRREMLAKDDAGTDLSRMPVVDARGNQISVGEFLGGLGGARSALSQWNWEDSRRLQGAQVARDAADIRGEFRTYLWMHADDRDASGDVQVFEIPVFVERDRLLVGAFRLEMTQAEPVEGFARFAKPIKPESSHIVAIDDPNIV